MRGFLSAGLVLVGLDLVLRSPTSRVAQLLALPTSWLKKWTDASTPLIAQKATTQSATTQSAAPPTSPVLL